MNEQLIALINKIIARIDTLLPTIDNSEEVLLISKTLQELIKADNVDKNNTGIKEIETLINNLEVKLQSGINENAVDIIELENIINDLKAKIESGLGAEELKEIETLINNLDAKLQSAIDGNAVEISDISTTLNSHITNYNNPNKVTKEQIGLGLVDNFSSTSDITDSSENKFSTAKATHSVASMVNTAVEDINVSISALSSQLDSKFSVNGGTLNGNLNVNGTIVATSNVAAYSDVRLKENIVGLKGCLKKLSNIKGYKYTFKNDNKTNIGLLAQEIEKEFPELIEGESIKALLYGNLSAVLVEAINELANKIDTVSRVLIEKNILKEIR